MKAFELELIETDKQQKDRRISKEIQRLSTIFKKLDKDAKNTVSSLVKNAAFMTITLEDLQEVMNAEGVVSEYQNGENQFGTKKSPEVEIYNTMIKNHMAIIKQLTDLLPKPVVTTGTGDEINEFVKAK